MLNSDISSLLWVGSHLVCLDEGRQRLEAAAGVSASEPCQKVSSRKIQKPVHLVLGPNHSHAVMGPPPEGLTLEARLNHVRINLSADQDCPFTMEQALVSSSPTVGNRVKTRSELIWAANSSSLAVLSRLSDELGFRVASVRPWVDALAAGALLHCPSAMDSMVDAAVVLTQQQCWVFVRRGPRLQWFFQVPSGLATPEATVATLGSVMTSFVTRQSDRRIERLQVLYAAEAQESGALVASSMVNTVPMLSVSELGHVDSEILECLALEGAQAGCCDFWPMREFTARILVKPLAVMGVCLSVIAGSAMSFNAYQGHRAKVASAAKMALKKAPQQVSLSPEQLRAQLEAEVAQFDRLVAQEGREPFRAREALAALSAFDAQGAHVDRIQWTWMGPQAALLAEGRARSRESALRAGEALAAMATVARGGAVEVSWSGTDWGFYVKDLPAMDPQANKPGQPNSGLPSSDLLAPTGVLAPPKPMLRNPGTESAPKPLFGKESSR